MRTKFYVVTIISSFVVSPMILRIISYSHLQSFSRPEDFIIATSLTGLACLLPAAPILVLIIGIIKDFRGTLSDKYMYWAIVISTIVAIGAIFGYFWKYVLLQGKEFTLQ